MDVVSGELGDETVDYLSPARFHFITFGYHFRILLGGILIKCFMLVLS
jgi:hypothetical protein